MTSSQPMQGHSTSTVLGRRLGGELLKLRTAAGLTQPEAAKTLTASTTKVAKMEGGWVPVRDPDIRALCELYGVDEPTAVARLLELARVDRERRKAKGWWNDLPNIGEMREYVSLESAATSIRTWQICYVPGLLQTPGYVKALVMEGARREHLDGGQSRVEQRAARQHRLADEQPLSLWAVIHESALRHRIGGAEVMREQLTHLLNETRRENITIQVLPLAAGAHVGMSGAFNILSFDAPGSMDVGYTETLLGQLWVEGGEGAAQYDHLFDRLAAQALPERESRTFVATLRKEL